MKSLSITQPQQEECNTIIDDNGQISSDNKTSANLLGSYYQKTSKLNFNAMDKDTENYARKLVHFFNLSWRLGRLPRDWKKALIIPIRKSSKKACYPESFRPIALTNFSFAVFLDLSKAFDRVWRNKLIIKLFNTFGIRDRALSWIFDFLKDREIRVRFRDSLSKTFRLSQGVPQGSVLSPLLFSFYIAGIEKIISRRCEVGLFADDIVLWNSNSDVVHIETAINTTLSDIQIFAEQHKLIFNVSKSTSSFFTTNRRLYNYQPQIFMESKSLLYEKHPKYLGYILDPEILSNKHIDYVINKGRKRLDLLKYIAGRDWGADAGTLRLTYTSLIRPVLEYGSQIYFSASRTNLAKLDRVQSSAARIITGMRHSCPTDLVLFEADIMPLDLRRKLLLSKYFCKLYSYGDYNRTSAYLITWTNRHRLKRDSPFSRMQAMDLLDQDIEEHFLKNVFNPQGGIA
ncbi:probable RNA-directed DNA polymerase from transposon BS [Trichonephila clavipes]|nr:probable RNA-directed DNA polymerase from transposon BS [Trichonephila clavipes]